MSVSRRRGPTYAEKMSAIRPFVSFSFKRADKRLALRNKFKITKYYNFINEVKDDYRIVKPSKRVNFENAQADLNKSFQRVDLKTKDRHIRIKETEFSVLFTPKTSNFSGVKKTKRGYAFTTETAGGKQEVVSRVYFEDKEDYEEDPEKYLRKLLKRYGPKVQFRWFSPKENYTSPGSFDKEAFIKEVKRLAVLYDRQAFHFIEGVQVEYK